jgi:hypothetical protein
MNALTTFNDDLAKAGKTLLRNAAYDLDAVSNLREFNERQSAKDPSRLAWPATLPIELALRTASPQELKEHYEYDDETWLALRDHPAFVADLQKACDLVKQDGMSFKLKCQLQAEGMLETNWKMVHASNNEVPPAVKARLMEATWRMAGYDNKSDGGMGGGANFAIQINLR